MSSSRRNNMTDYRKEDSTLTSHLLNLLAVWLPLLNIWNVAVEKGLIRSNSARMKNLGLPLPLNAVLVLLVALFLLSQFTAWFFRWWLKQYHGAVNVDHALHNFIRDSGLFSPLMALLSIQNAVQVLKRKPSILWPALRLRFTRRLVRYGDQSPSQRMEVFFPPHDGTKEPVSGLVIFVHGGAWGSGSPAMYRLAALPFLKLNWAVAIHGYRVYPEGDVSTQIEDLESAAAEMAKRYPNLCRGKVCLLGHSSGAHICLLALVERARRQLELSRLDYKASLPDSKLSMVGHFCAVSAPYNINHHFDFEAGRQVEQISPLKPACGNSREMFLRYSPPDQLKEIASQCTTPDEKQLLSRLLPRMTLIHGRSDATVPDSSTKEAARVMKATGVVQCDEIYLDDLGHEESIMEVMLGGPAQDILSGLVQEL